MSSVESIRAEFDAKAKGYESGRLGGWYKAQAELLVERARLQAGSSVLDVGCGTGWLLRTLAHRYAGITGLGLDLSPRMIDVARERARVEAVDGLTFVAGDWTQLDPLLLIQANGIRSVDLVCCVSAFHYFDDPSVALEKMFGVLRPSGRLLLLDRARDRSPGTLLWEVVHRLILRDIARFYHSDRLVALVAEAGFDDARIETRLRRLLWKRKIMTSLALVSGRKP